MTFTEFQHWLRGYSAAFTAGAPNAEQWTVIQAELAEVRAPTVASPASRPDHAILPGWPGVGPRLDQTFKANGEAIPGVICTNGAVPGRVVNGETIY
jgi:hypothetical protein